MENNLSITCQPEQMQKLVTQLIKEDLRCNKLVLGLSNLGLDAGKYHTELSALVFNLMNMDHNDDQLLTQYFDCIDRAAEIEDIENQQSILQMAEEIFTKLETARK